MAKRARLSSSFNPVYPYEDESSSQHPFINPGFISPNGFTQSQDGALTLKCVAPLTTTSGSLDIKVGGGLRVDPTDGSLEEDTKVNAPLSKTNHSISLETGNGLELQNSQLCAKLGEGLKFNLNKICVDYDINTLWTGVNPNTNCQMLDDSESNDCKLTFILNKNGALVNAYVSVVGVTDLFNILTTQKSIIFNAQLYFDSDGNLITDLSSLKTPLNHKTGQQMSTSVLTNAKSFMPSIAAYPFNNNDRAKENYIYGTCYYKALDNTLYPMDVSVMLNRRAMTATTAYCISITWSWNVGTAPETTTTTLVTSPFYFSYIREDD
ncbi:fiber [Human mastadenovirus B]|nr:fiber [Human mastadenovirus B]